MVCERIDQVFLARLGVLLDLLRGLQDKSLFSLELRYTLPDHGLKLIRLYNSDNLLVDITTAQQLQLTDGNPHIGDTPFVPGDC